MNVCVLCDLAATLLGRLPPNTQPAHASWHQRRWLPSRNTGAPELLVNSRQCGMGRSCGGLSSWDGGRMSLLRATGLVSQLKCGARGARPESRHVESCRLQEVRTQANPRWASKSALCDLRGEQAVWGCDAVSCPERRHWVCSLCRTSLSYACVIRAPFCKSHSFIS